MPPTTFNPPASRKPPVCPLFTMAILQPPSALVTNAPQSIATLPCIGPSCAFFHSAGVCSINMIAEALRTQAAVMLTDGKEEGEGAGSKPSGTPQ